MITRAFIIIAGAVMAAGFLVFAGNIVRLGMKEFFKGKKAPEAPATSAAAPTAAAPVAP